jgi:hypothetical protein
VAVYTDLFIATAADVLSAPLDGHSPIEYFPTIQAKGITPLHLATLEAIVTGQTDPYALMDARLDAWDASVVREWSNDVAVERVPDALVKALARLAPQEIAHAAKAWEDTDEMRATVDRPEHVAWLAGFLHDVCQLARRATTEGKNMYLWTAV